MKDILVKGCLFGVVFWATCAILKEKGRNGEFDMAIMYLAKINLTEGIFDVYDNKLNLDDVKQTIYDELDEKKTPERFVRRISLGSASSRFVIRVLSNLR